ncbi:MAG: YbjQ family protein [Phascolarctobacterium sp.]|nr:YbjQ family protein [Phascolarctobacterium sp.]
MLMTTTAALQGKEIVEYKGLVFGEVVSGVNIFKDMFSGIRDVIGGRSGAYEGEIEEARDKALEEMAKRAEKMGANAVIAVDVDYEVLGEKNGMLMVSVSGTAVVVK